MTIRQIHGFGAGLVRAFLDWDQTPGVRYRLDLTSDGRIIEWSARDERGLSARRLRQVPVKTMERFVRQHLSAAAEQRPRRSDLSDFAAHYQAKIDDWYRRWDEHQPPDRVLAVAVAYAAAVRAGAKSPNVAVAERLHLSTTTVRNYVFEAREKGLLTHVSRGKAGGELTDKAKEILDGK